MVCGDPRATTLYPARGMPDHRTQHLIAGAISSLCQRLTDPKLARCTCLSSSISGSSCYNTAIAVIPPGTASSKR